MMRQQVLILLIYLIILLLTGNRIDFFLLMDYEGDSGTLELNVCDTATPGDCSTLFVPWEITDVQAKLAGYSDIGAYETVTNPNIGGFLQDVVEAPCTEFHVAYIIPEEIYKGQGFEGTNLPAGMGVDSNNGGVAANFDCITQVGDEEFPMFTYGNSGTMTVVIKSLMVDFVKNYDTHSSMRLETAPA